MTQTGILPSLSGTATQQAVTATNTLGAQTITYLRQICSTGFNLLWRNSQGLSPQDYCTSLGTQAAAILGIYQGLVTIANAIHSGSITLTPPPSATLKNQDGTAAPQTLTANQDGTVTVSG